MQKKIVFFLVKINLAIVLTLFLAVGPVNGQDFPDGLIGISSTGPAILYSIDEATGHATPIVTLNGYASITGLAFLQRTLYGTDLGGFPGGVSSENIGSISAGGTIDFLGIQNGSFNWFGLAADETRGILYTIDNDKSNLLTAQFPNGLVETIGSGAGINGCGMEYDDTHGILYALSSDASLYTVSTETGTASLIGPTGIESASSSVGLAYDECSQILYANYGNLKQLYTLDVTTGTATLVGPNGVDEVIDGLAWKGPCGPGAITSQIPTTLRMGLNCYGGYFGNSRIYRYTQKESYCLT